MKLLSKIFLTPLSYWERDCTICVDDTCSLF
nr:MAG TPA_asm: hypothetical protein [Caudoviricetes sp.]